MQPVTEESLSSNARPWLHVTTDLDMRAAADRVISRGGKVVYLEGRNLASVGELFDSYASAFEFPDYFGRNWNAFDECITTLSEVPAPAYLTVISGADDVLIEDPADLSVFLRLVDEAGRTWSRKLGLGPEWGGGDVAFNTVLTCSSVEGAQRLGRARQPL